MIWHRFWLWATAGAAFVLAIAVSGLLLVDLGDPPNLLLFIGRFHPMVVHFPIGLLVLAALLEVFSLLRPLRSLRYVIAFVLFLGAVSAVAAVIAGLLLSLEGGYDEQLVSRHRWLGIGVALGAIAAALIKGSAGRRPSRVAARVYGGVLAGTIGTLLAAGHLGGSLTHGPGYLTDHLPPAARALLGGVGSRQAATIADIDSAVVYADLVAPILGSRCTSCHGAEKQKGGLRLDSAEFLLRGGDSGPAVIAGLPDESELLRRITLPPGHEDAMPPGGARPLEVGETELIRWWVQHGASLEARVADIEEIPSSVATLFRRIAPPREEKRSGIYALPVREPDARAVAALRSAGFGIEPVAGDLALLQVTTVNLQRTFGDEQLRRLIPVADQITWLDLSGTAVTDRGLEVLARMPNLTRLSLARTPAGDAAVRHLAGLKHLEYLNLYGTRISDRGIRQIEGLPALRVLYLWQTEVTPAAADSLRARHPKLEIVFAAEPRRSES